MVVCPEREQVTELVAVGADVVDARVLSQLTDGWILGRVRAGIKVRDLRMVRTDLPNEGLRDH